MNRRTPDPTRTALWRELVLGPGLRRMLVGAGVAVGGTAAATGIGLAAELPPAAAYLGVVVVAAAIGGLWPGLLAAGAGFFGFVFYFMPPRGSVTPSEVGTVFLLLVFVLLAVLVAILDAAWRSARTGRDALALLADAQRTLGGSLDYSRTVGHLCRLVVPRFADWCAVHIRGEGDALLTMKVAHADPEKEELARELYRRFPPDTSGRESPLHRVMATGRSELIRRISDALLQSAARDEEHLQALRGLGLRSAIVVPLMARDRVIGALTLIRAESRRRYAGPDLAFAEELARSAGVAIDNARLYQERARIARTLQHSLLPTELPEIPDVEVAVRYRPMEAGALVGGDFYDLFEAGDGAWAVAVGDICGKGPEAAALTGLVRHTMRTASVGERKPSAVLEAVNRQVGDEKSDRFATMSLGRLERTDDGYLFTISCGGHPAPLFYRADQSVGALDCLGTLLGVFPDPHLQDVPLELHPGDCVLFYTDGITDRYERGGVPGEPRLVSLLWGSAGMDAETIADRIYRDAGEFDDGPPRDDMALVVVRMRP